jgi:putative endonuclease
MCDTICWFRVEDPVLREPSSGTKNAVILKKVTAFFLGVSMYYVYVLISAKDGQFYIGQTNDINKRIIKHQKGYVRSTRDRRPLKLVHIEKFTDRAQAMRREKFLKSGEGHTFLNFKLVNTIP